MAETKTQTKAPDAPAPAPAPAPAEQPERDTGAYRYEITTPNPGFFGDRFGVKFQGGRGYSNDAAVAAACEDCGYTVKRQRKSDEPAKK